MLVLGPLGWHFLLIFWRLKTFGASFVTPPIQPMFFKGLVRLITWRSQVQILPRNRKSKYNSILITLQVLGLARVVCVLQSILLPVLLPLVRFLTRCFFKSWGKNPFHRGLVIVEYQFKYHLPLCGAGRTWLVRSVPACGVLGAYLTAPINTANFLYQVGFLRVFVPLTTNDRGFKSGLSNWLIPKLQS